LRFGDCHADGKRVEESLDQPGVADNPRCRGHERREPIGGVEFTN